MLVSENAKICITPNTKLKICVSPNANPQREPVEDSSCWVTKGRVRVGHVDLMSFTSYSLALGTQREPSFQWSIGFKPVFHWNLPLRRLILA